MEQSEIAALLDTGAIVVVGPGVPVARRGEGLRGVNVRVDASPLLPGIDGT